MFIECFYAEISLEYQMANNKKEKRGERRVRERIKGKKEDKEAEKEKRIKKESELKDLTVKLKKKKKNPPSDCLHIGPVLGQPFSTQPGHLPIYNSHLLVFSWARDQPEVKKLWVFLLRSLLRIHSALGNFLWLLKFTTFT